MIPSITVAQLRAQSHAQLVDVRSPSEFAAGHIPGAINIPMDQIESRIGDLSSGAPIVLVCQMGQRARMTASLLEPCQRELAVLEGGTNAWIAAGMPVVSNVKTRWSLERQVRLGAGLLVLTGVILALALDAHWLYLAAFIGLGLTFAAVTDFCPMAVLLAKMPWNATSRCSLGISQQKHPGASQ